MIRLTNSKGLGISEADMAISADPFFISVDVARFHVIAVEAMKRSERKMLEAIRYAKPDAAKRYRLIHKQMVRQRRAYARLEQERGGIVGDLG